MAPRMDGFAFAAEMHAHTEWRSIPIIVVTAKDLTSDDRLRLNGAVERYIQKGTHTSEELLAEVSDLVAARVRDRERCTVGTNR
jgi:CheY-like chemotaxis protein